MRIDCRGYALFHHGTNDLAGGGAHLRNARGGNVRYVVRDADGNEYTTFREQIGEKAPRKRSRRTSSTRS
jgi:hypothetical protein